MLLTVKIGTNRSDRAVWRVEALWPVWQGPTGLTGSGRVRVQLGFFIDLDLVIGFLTGQVHPPYKYKGPRPIETSNRSKYRTITTFYPRFQTLTFPTLICCSSFVSATSEGVLRGLPILEQLYVRLPWRGPSRASVRRPSPISPRRSVWPVP